ncbi:TRAP transporter large permease [Georhizobium profundi]|jgi:C4-dicarboxylate transporter, DctM subunit|uniref:TRAP transporter large permease protein n=1 Tax=Georhizobium profundi TaxID=2341112 RepID=A0A3Q8XN01_9HYPH|nr:TRAP transporter large permease [Georhizobium profundi]AZN71223.1 TRAP transporter large permease [Georhizobium profundi]GLQ37298.1 C4-dicarboxylate ABC transporter permease [Rhizobium albus]
MDWPIGVALLLGLIFCGVPIAFAMAGVGLVGVASIIGWTPTLSLIGQTYFDGGRSYTLSVVPLFLLMGNLVVQSGVAAELFKAANAWLGHRKGGLAMATIVACGGFSSVCGSSLATTATMARIALPEMRRFGYSDRLASSSIASGGTLGILIPPSVILVIYGILTQQNIGMLFLAGLLPGLVGIVFYIFAVRLSLVMYKEELAVQPKLPLIERFRALKGVFWALALFVFVLGGIYVGAFTATEAAGMGAGGAFLLTAARGRLTLRDTLATLFDTAKTTAVMFFILFGALFFLNYVNFSGLTTDLREWINLLGVGPYQVIFSIVIIYLILGCLLESLSMVTLTVPIFFPIVVGLGFDPIWFGIFVVIATELSYITPPIGMNIFVMRSVAPEVPIERIYAGVVPFVAVDIVRLALLIFVPGLALIIPQSM